MRLIALEIATYAAFAALGFAVGFHVQPAKSHSFYDVQCCSEKDCRPVPASSVKEGPAGYEWNGRVIPYGASSVKQSPDGGFHVCTLNGADGGLFLCLYAPGRMF